MATENSTEDKPFRFCADTRNQRERDYWGSLEAVFNASPFTSVEKLMNFPLYVPRQSMTNFIIKYEIFKRIVNVHGSVIECGTLFGGGLMTFAQLSAIFEPVNHQRRIVGFDTFAGFPKISDEDQGDEVSRNAHEDGLAVDSYDEILRCIDLYDSNRSVGHIPKVELVRGDATETIPAFVASNQQLLVSLLYLDFDVYDPTAVALKEFVPRMPKGAVIAFDELNLKDWPGETVAMLEALDIRDLRIERFAFGSTISFVQLD